VLLNHCKYKKKETVRLLPPTYGSTAAIVQIEWEKQKSQLADLVVEINKPLKKLDRATLITLCTIDVHARDVLARLIDERVEDVTCFQWQSQLRYIVHEKTKKCQVCFYLLDFLLSYLLSSLFSSPILC
jgi:hypothetical protein